MPPNVLLVVLDSVRAKNLQILGHHRDNTPFLNQFLARSTNYRQARSAGARSITGHASLFTGSTVEEHELTTADRELVEGSTVFETLQEAGYNTAVFSENVWITELDIGMERGFDAVVGPQNVPFPDALDARRFVAANGRGNYREFVRTALGNKHTFKALANGVSTKLSSDYPALYPFDASAPGEVYVDRFLDWQADQDGPWGACINLMDAHGPYEPSAEHNHWGDDQLLDIQEQKPNNWQLLADPSSWWKLSAVESLYDGAIHQLDALLDRLVSELEGRGEFDDTLLVVTSDHGEGFGEPSRVRPSIRVAGHNTSLHEVILHVPLVVSYPHQDEGETVDSLATLTQFPSVVEGMVNGEPSREDFCVDRAYASSYALLVDEQLRSRANRFLDIESLDGFDERLRAVYENEGWGVRKKIAYGDEKAVSMHVEDAQTTCEIIEIDPEEVDTEFDSITDQELVVGGAGIEAVDQATKDRLERLGYM